MEFLFIASLAAVKGFALYQQAPLVYKGFVNPVLSSRSAAPLCGTPANKISGVLFGFITLPKESVGVCIRVHELGNTSYLSIDVLVHVCTTKLANSQGAAKIGGQEVGDVCVNLFL